MYMYSTAQEKTFASAAEFVLYGRLSPETDWNDSASAPSFLHDVFIDP